jgi:hypothetical protein
MSAELPTPAVDQPRQRSQVVKTNRRQVMLYALLTVILTVATVWGGRILLKDSETLTFAVGAPDGNEAALPPSSLASSRAPNRGCG